MYLLDFVIKNSKNFSISYFYTYLFKLCNRLKFMKALDLQSSNVLFLNTLLLLLVKKTQKIKK